MPDHYAGLCDASAAVLLDDTTFVVADDEHNHLHFYRLGERVELDTLDLVPFLEVKRGKESDLEGAARIGNRTWWIGSHSRNPDGEEKKGRHRLFALDIAANADGPRLVPAGIPYRGLLADMIAADNLQGLGLGDASLLAAEAEGGLNIEGLAATPEGTLLIGFRNPLINGKALIVPLLNPADLIAEQGNETARFGTPILFDLGLRGIRDLDRHGDGLLIVAGPTADVGDFSLFRWSGKPGAPAVELSIVLPDDLHPEVIFTLPQANRAIILSDDGKRLIGGMNCQDLPEAQRRFRALTLEL